MSKATQRQCCVTHRDASHVNSVGITIGLVVTTASRADHNDTLQTCRGSLPVPTSTLPVPTSTLPVPTSTLPVPTFKFIVGWRDRKPPVSAKTRHYILFYVNEVEQRLEYYEMILFGLEYNSALQPTEEIYLP